MSSKLGWIWVGSMLERLMHDKSLTQGKFAGFVLHYNCKINRGVLGIGIWVIANITFHLGRLNPLMGTIPSSHGQQWEQTSTHTLTSSSNILLECSSLFWIAFSMPTTFWERPVLFGFTMEWNKNSRKDQKDESNTKFLQLQKYAYSLSMK